MSDIENFEDILNDERLDEVSAGVGIDAKLLRKTELNEKLPEVRVECPVCGKITRKRIRICNCPSDLWGNHMCFGSLCEECEKKNKAGILEREIEFKDIGNGKKRIVRWKGNH